MHTLKTVSMADLLRFQWRPSIRTQDGLVSPPPDAGAGAGPTRRS